MKIWLDDNRACPNDGDGWILFITAPEVITYLSVKAHYDSVELISLDYDLSWSGRNAGTGIDVLKWFEELVYTDIIKELPKIRVHSTHPYGNQEMNKMLYKMQRYIDSK